MSNVRSRLRSVIWSKQDGRTRAVWRILVPLLAGFLVLQFVSTAAFTFDLNSGDMMLAAFGGTTVVMVALLGLFARHLDHRPVREYGYRLSRSWWYDLVVGIGLGMIVVALTFVIGRYTNSLRVTGTGLLPETASVGRFLLFFAAFAGVAFYEEYIYRGSFVTNAVEGLSARGISGPVATTLAVLTSTLAFAAIHVPGAIAGEANISLVLVKTGLLGGLLGIAYIWTDELAFPMGVHLGVNYALMNVFGIDLTLGAVAALLMLIGYSVDSDILLNNHILRRRGGFYESTYRAMRTGVTMTLTSLAAMIVMTIVATMLGIPLLPDIALILVFGLSADLMNTYLMNVSLLRWYKYEGVAR